MSLTYLGTFETTAPFSSHASLLSFQRSRRNDDFILFSLTIGSTQRKSLDPFSSRSRSCYIAFDTNMNSPHHELFAPYSSFDPETYLRHIDTTSIMEVTDTANHHSDSSTLFPLLPKELQLCSWELDIQPRLVYLTKLKDADPELSFDRPINDSTTV